MKAIVLLAILFGSHRQLSSAHTSDASKPNANVPSSFSADQFDWREILPYLSDAATLPGEQGIKAVMENCEVLRIYVDRQLTDCRASQTACIPASPNDRAREISRTIDQIVQEGISHRHDIAFVDYKFVRQPFPFSEIAASKSEKHPNAYLMLALTDHNYTAADVQAKYGAPYDTDIFQWYSIFKYRMEGPGYNSKAIFEVDPTDGGVVKIAISLKTKKPKNSK